MRTKATELLRPLTTILLVANLGTSAIGGYTAAYQSTSNLTILHGVLIASLAMVLSVQYVTVPHRPPTCRAPESLLLTAWIAWAILGFIVHGGSDTSIVVVGFPVLAAAAQRVVIDSGSLGVSRLLAIAVTLHICGAAGITLLTSAEAFDNGRLTLLSLEPNELARIAAIGTLSGLWLMGSRARLDIMIAISAVGLGSAALLLTVSRTSILGLFVAAAVIVAYSAHKRLAALALGAGLLFFVVPLSVRAQPAELGPATAVAERSGQDVRNFGGRSLLWPLVIEKIKESPTFGVGIGNDQAAVNTLKVGWDPQHAHNLVLHLALTTGAIGALVLISAILTALVRALIHRRGLALSLIVFVVLNGVSEPVIRLPSIGWFALAASVFLTANSPAPAVRTSALPQSPRSTVRRI